MIVTNVDGRLWILSVDGGYKVYESMTEITKEYDDVEINYYMNNGFLSIYVPAKSNRTLVVDVS